MSMDYVPMKKDPYSLLVDAVKMRYRTWSHVFVSVTYVSFNALSFIVQSKSSRQPK